MNDDDNHIEIDRCTLNLRRLRKWYSVIMRGEKEVNGRYVIEPAMVAKDFADSFNLVHDSYVAAGYMHANPFRLRVRSGFESNAGMVTFVARDLAAERRIVGTLSVVSDSAFGLPSEGVFAKEIQCIKDTVEYPVEYPVELAGLAVHSAYRHSNIALELTRVAGGWCFFTGCDAMFIVTSPKSAKFYQELFLFNQIGAVKSYATNIYDPVVCLWSDPQATRVRFDIMDKVLGEDAFLVDYFAHSNPVLVHLRHLGRERINMAYHRTVTDALDQYLNQFLSI